MAYSRTQWRLLISPPAHGAWNMAVDEAILEAVGKNHVPPTLRLYAWEPPCISLGYAQVSVDIDLRRLKGLDWEWVRRPTGGRAILHTDELTYSVIGPSDEPRLSGSVLESYRCLSTALLAALHLLGVPAESQSIIGVGSGASKGPVCFEVPSNYEIIFQGKKLIGSAQARRKTGVLQHGTLPLWGDLTRITQALCFQQEEDRSMAAARLLARATTLETILGCRITWEAAAQAFINAFQSELNLDLISAQLTPQEKKRTKELVREKYSNTSWLERI